MSQSGQRPNIIGEHLRARRLETGLAMREVGQRAGVSEATVSRIETGITLPTANVLVAIGAALDLNLAELLGKLGANLTQELPEFQAYLRAKYDLPEEVITRVHEFFQAQLKTEVTEG